MKKNNTQDYEISSGNVFADLDLPNPEEKLAKAEIARQINNLIKEKKINQTEAAKLLNVDQPKISALSNGNLTGFSLERLFKFLNILGQDITIKITPKRRTTLGSGITISLPKQPRKQLPKVHKEMPALVAKKKAKG